jgi:hypothetical protein
MNDKTFEYHVYLLDEQYHLRHKGEPILGTDNLAVACSYCYTYYNTFKIPICVYQPRTDGYREHYAPWLLGDQQGVAEL